ncbi:MAG: molybdenum cofactor guanylyltransferase [Candidatus Hadarchaeum sp.]|uniref:molybdenum cofactor guanylyltransferase n=1 Tax=Candidatus Hadarchaeum sp. TaxID=2883567 RepID=UPI00316EEAAC
MNNYGFREKFAVLILAGGDSKRMGCPKAFYEINGKPLIKHVFERINRLSGEIIISCKLYQEDLARTFPEAKVVVDKSSEEGPMIGLFSSLPVVSSEYVAVLACDCPWIKPEVVEFLYFRARGHDGAILRWPNGYIEPLQAVYRTKKLTGAIIEARKKNKFRMIDAINLLDDVIYIAPEDLEKIDPSLKSFNNINSPNDL